MAQIEVDTSDHGTQFEFQVTVREGGSATRHRVVLHKVDYERLAGDKASPEELVSESFRFLLERESKESILGSFNLTLIGHYFPMYEQEIANRL